MTQPLALLEWEPPAARGTVTSTAAAVLQKIKDLADAAGCTTETVSISATLSVVGIKLPKADVADLRIVFFANASSQSVTMLSPDSETTNRLHVGISKGVTVETLSTVASGGNPYGSTTFSGFWLCSTILTSITNIWALFSEEGLSLAMDTNSANSVCGCDVGAVIDPRSERSGNCETSGRIYGMSVSGNAAWSSGFWASVSGGRWYHSTTAGQAHAGCFQPGTSGWITLRRGPAEVNNPTLTTDFVALDGTAIAMPVYLTAANIAGAANGMRVVGRLREIFMWKDDSHARTVNIDPGGGAVVAGYTYGSTIAAATDAAFFAARDNRA